MRIVLGLAQWFNCLILCLQIAASHTGTNSCPSCSTSCPAPCLGSCLGPGKAAEDGPKPWDPTPMWETQRKLLAFGFASAQVWSTNMHSGKAVGDGSSNRNPSTHIADLNWVARFIFVLSQLQSLGIWSAGWGGRHSKWEFSFVFLSFISVLLKLKYLYLLEKLQINHFFTHLSNELSLVPYAIENLLIKATWHCFSKGNN